MSLLNDASLVLIPSGYKEDKVYSIIPSDGSGDLDFVRGSEGTRINSLGQVENVCWNLFNDSEDFTFGTWSKVSSTVTGNTTVAPNGTTTADTIVISAGGYLYVQVNYTATAGETISMSVYSKSSTAGFLVYGGATIAGTDVEVIENVGNGWYRHIITRTFTTSATGLVQFVGGYFSPGTFQIWGAQLNKGAIKPYFKTTDRLNVPRLTYENGCPSLLLEKQSTNINTWSEDLTQSDWQKNNSTITANDIISPDGTQNADKFTASSTGSVYVYNANTSFSLNRTNSVYLKKGNWNEVTLLGNGYNQGTYATFDLNAGTILSSANCTPFIQSVGNGWYRCGANVSTNYVHLITLNGHTNNSIPNGSYIYMWGAQTEQSAYATSYIPTTSTSVTRSADYCQNFNFSSIIGQTEGTIFAEVYYPNIQAGGGSSYVYFTSGSFSNSVVIGREPETPAKYLFYINAGGSNILYNTSNVLQNNYVKLAIGYKSGDWAAYLNGTQVASGTDVFSFGNTMSRFGVGTNDGAVTLIADSMHLKQSLLFQRRLTNTELAQLTTL